MKRPLDNNWTKQSQRHLFRSLAAIAADPAGPEALGVTPGRRAEWVQRGAAKLLAGEPPMPRPRGWRRPF